MTTSRLRWRVARILDQLPRTCWTGLVTWTQHGRRTPGLSNRDCRAQAATCRHGCCYCGKIGGRA